MGEDLLHEEVAHGAGDGVHQAAPAACSAVTVTWLGTASARIESPAGTLLLDPYVKLPGAENPTKLEDFLGADALLITHGHLDHLASVPALLRRQPLPAYCTKTPAKLLVEELGQGILAPEGPVHVIAPGDMFDAAGAHICVLQGRHIHFDVPLVAHTLNPANIARAPQNLPQLMRQNHRFQEAGETLFYDMDVCGWHIQAMGSLALDDHTAYPIGADLLFLPYQGSSHLPAHAHAVLERLQPKAILVTHFDDAFPPVSSRIPLDDLYEMMRTSHPEIQIFTGSAVLN